MCRYILQLLVLTAALLVPLPLSAEDTAVSSADTVFVLRGLYPKLSQRALGKIPWKYSAGDNPLWSQPTFDDSQWKKLKPFFHIDSIPQGTWTGMGWFRLRFRADSSLCNRALALTNFFDGASEVWLDGKFLRRWGTPGHSKADEILPQEYSNSAFAPIILFGTDTTEHVLAVRYSYWHWEEIAARWGWFFRDRLRDNIGFSPLVKEIAAASDNSAYTLKTLQYAIYFAVPAIIGFLHLILFIFYRHELSGLFLAGFAACSALLAFSILASSAFLHLSLEQIILFSGVGGAIAFPAMHVFLLLALYAMFYDRIPRYSFFFVVLGILLVISELTWSYAWRPLVPRWILFGLLFLLLVEIARVTVVSMVRRQTGAWILGVGVLVFCFSSGTGEFYLQILRKMRPDTLFYFIRIPVYLALPMSMSFLMAYRSARAHRLLARQNQELEAEVRERVKDLRSANEEIQRQMEVQTEQSMQIERVNNQLLQLNEELRAGNMALDEANRFKMQMLSIVAHDLKNPLGAILNFVDLLTDMSEQQSPQHDIGSHIGATVRQMLKLVTDLLDTAAAETGKLHIVGQPMELTELVKETIAFYSQTAADKEQNIICIAPAEVWVNADWQRFRQVVDNLVSNAIKFSAPKKTITVSVALENSHARLAVSDEGPGLTEDDKAHLFEYFQRLSAQPTGGESSSGVGLAIVKRIVELHAGEVRVESEAGKGATFIVELPALHDYAHGGAAL